MWKLLFVLPNIKLKEPIESEYIAIVPHNDPRIIKITKESQFAYSLINNFENQFKAKVFPAALIVTENCPNDIYNIESLVAYRNIFAIPTLCKGQEYYINGNNWSYPCYSDYFSFYPVTIGKDDDCYIIHTPCLSGYYSKEDKFSGQTAPELAGNSYSLNKPSDELFNELNNAWVRKFVKGYDKKILDILFRSLEMAYYAMSLPFKNHSTVYDYGTNASLWVSAFEILSYPNKQHSDLFTVLDMIEEFDFIDPKLKNKNYYFKHGKGKKRINVNLAQKIYYILYQNRNSFLHGNPISIEKLRFDRNKKSQFVPNFISIIYSLCLRLYLDKNFKNSSPLSFRDYLSASTLLKIRNNNDECE